jgi:hypothetical protein
MRLGEDAERAADIVACLLSPGGDARLDPNIRSDLVLLSVLFQNVDLLYAESHPAADRVARRIMEAIHEMEARDG